MAWVIVDDAIFDHPKIIAAGPHATLLHIAAIAWSNRNLTDGFIPVGKVATLVNWREVMGGDIDQHVQHLLDLLLELRLWHTVDSGYRVHDYLKYQRSRKQILAKRAQEATRQSRYRSRIMSRRDLQRDSCVSTSPPNPNPNPIKKKTLTSFEQKKKMSRLPADETLTPERLRMAHSLGLTTAGATLQWATMADHEFYRPRADWDGTWRNWCRKAVASQRPSRPAPQSRPAMAQPMRLGDLLGQFTAPRAPPNGTQEPSTPQPGDERPDAERSDPRRTRS